MHDVYKYWSRNNTKYTNLKYYFMSVGCNDLVNKTPHELFTSVHKLVVSLKESFPGIKIILSEVTPRMDHIDERVKDVNRLFEQYVAGKQDLFLTRNSNLRNPDFYHPDGIHLKKTISARFANNMKIALRAAHGMKKQNRNLNDPHILTAANGNHGSVSNQQQQFNDQQVLQQLLLRIVRAFQYPGT